MSDYTAKDIRILEGNETQRFAFVRVKMLSEQYPHIATEFIERLLTSCQLSGFPEDLAIRRYLEGDKTIQPSPELIACHKEQLAQQRGR